MTPKAIIAGVAAFEAWFLGGPVDGRLMPVETTGECTPPAVVRMAEGGLYVGASDAAMPVIEHVYVLAERVDDIQVYRYQATPEHRSMALDAPMSDEPALIWLRRALADFYIRDRALLRARVSEWGLTFRLGHHLAHHVDPGWDVDAEYDRQGMQGERKVRDPDAETHMRPDLIVHRRGRSGRGSNRLFVEVKRRWRAPSGDPEDIDKVRQALVRHRYQVGVAVGMSTTGRRFSPTWAVYVSPPLSRGTYTEVPLVPRLEPVFDEAELDSLERAARRSERMPSPRPLI